MTLFAVASCNGLGNHLECLYDTTTMTYVIFHLLQWYLMNFEKLILLHPTIAAHFLCPLILILCLLAQSFLQSGAKFNFTSNLGRLFKLTKTSDHPDNLK